MDVLSSDQRSYNMSRIKGKNTKPEIIVRKLLWHNGYRYRLFQNDLPGKPDIVFGGRKKVIFIHGCFWHKHHCKYFKWPSTKVDFWRKKILGNVQRDKKNEEKLKTDGWDYLVVWECETKNKDLSRLVNRIEKFLTL